MEQLTKYFKSDLYRGHVGIVGRALGIEVNLS